MMQIEENPLLAFAWSPQPAAEAFVRALMEEFLRRNSFATTLAARMTSETGTRFFDWIDSIHPVGGVQLETQLTDLGFAAGGTLKDGRVYRHPHGIFPAIVIDRQSSAFCLYLKVDSVADFLALHGIETPISGEPFAPFRQAMVFAGQETWLHVVDRRGDAGFALAPADPAKRLAAATHLEHFRLRRRVFAREEDGFIHARRLILAAIRDIGVDQTCALFFQAEREFWQRKNRAAQVQKARQDRLGLGWSNHDHHTYRSSRQWFASLIALQELLGFTRRERFYAGREAGWGAQIMEQPSAGIITFNDVDLAPEELLIDFAHQPLDQRSTLGTVGLWCGLHGEAILQAGMHHLECQFDFAALKEQLESQHHIAVMKPFTDFPFLRQAFTEGERWPVAPARLEMLLSQGLITAEQAEKFRAQGAIGSHLENLERNEGYKGFNQKGVSEIISATDPRRS